MSASSTRKPDGFDDALWALLGPQQREHVAAYVREIVTDDGRAEPEASRAVEHAVHSQCWKALRRTLEIDSTDENGVRRTDVPMPLTLDQMTALEAFCVAGMLETMAAARAAEAKANATTN